jgi:GMP synthase-like glutamine amidotransferase
MPRITIIETGLVGPEYRERYGTFPQMFARMIAATEPSIAYDVVSIANSEPIPDPAALDAILITGSSAGAYDDADWIAPLEDFVRRAHDMCVPMVGVCFGHQLIAQALGGTVRKSEKGLVIGSELFML